MATYIEYEGEKLGFIGKHLKKSDYRIDTSPMENNCYHKEYVFEHGAVWYEVIFLIEEEIVVEVHGIRCVVTVKFNKTEYWSTDDGKSKFIYEHIS